MDSYYNRISKYARDLICEFKTEDPFSIADGLGISILYTPFEKLKGVYSIINGVSFIFLNENNCTKLNRIVLAHELGHHILHKDTAGEKPLSDNFLFGNNRKMELEANVFASELLLDDTTVVNYIKEGLDLNKIAILTETDPNLVAIKCSLLIKNGYNFIPQEYDTSFLK